MIIIEAPRAMQQRAAQWRCAGETIGFVPTMGALHEGHLSLARAARADCTKFVASIFVNPIQFGPHEDYGKYPRAFEHDCALLEEAGCAVLFAPTVASMYETQRPMANRDTDSRTFVEVMPLSEMWEGVVRPGHMRGVATVVAKLFNIVRPHRAYFGEKDYQQLKVLQHMVHDLNFDVEVVGMPTVREADGLALSSRNVYLNPEERQAALKLYQALQTAQSLARAGETDTAALGAAMQQVCDADPLIAVHYITIVEAETLAPLDKLDERPARALIAARVGATRLIDNLALAPF
ncbi:MAG TPA: pantoate--beta-alanine ligase [Abditibacteriaceae bacterium]|nr:pantoate--beta-alanine ligase [Abditibacteriaceae bacterium]